LLIVNHCSYESREAAGPEHGTATPGAFTGGRPSPGQPKTTMHWLLSATGSPPGPQTITDWFV
jgi:hypothetical protein